MKNPSSAICGVKIQIQVQRLQANKKNNILSRLKSLGDYGNTDPRRLDLTGSEGSGSKPDKISNQTFVQVTIFRKIRNISYFPLSLST